MLKTVSSLIFFLTCLIGIIILSLFYGSFDLSRRPNDYAIVFDAGSSGSRMYIYEWKAGFSAARGDPLVVTQKTACKPGDNGLDKIKSREELVEKYSKCIKIANAEIPEARKKRTYIFLAATAGMRLLNAINKTASDEIFGYVRDYFRGLDFLFKNDSQARIISGQEEGTDAWISANYYLNNFHPSNQNKKRSTSGILDLGGASTQIVYVPNNHDIKNDKYFSNIRIYGINYKPYSYSFLCWGSNQINLLYQTYLLSKNNYQNDTLAYCFPKNSKSKLTSKQISGSPCSNGLLFNNTYNFTANTSYLAKDAVYTFNGESNYENCLRDIRVLLPRPGCRYENDECSFGGAFQPPLEREKFMGFSGYYYAVTNTENLLKINLDGNMEAFKNSTNFICSQSLEQLIQLNLTNNAKIPENFLVKMCFANSYVIELLTIFGFNSFQDLKITEKVNGYNLNWALGFLINELNRDDFLPYEQPPRRLELPLFLTFTVILSVIGISALGYIIYKKVRSYRANVDGLPFNRKRNTEDDL